MVLIVNTLPYEILSQILENAAELNRQEGPQYTYGLSQAPEPLEDVGMQTVIRGHVPPDVQQWTAANAIRQVCRTWHDWATQYALRDIRISRWRGSERYVCERKR